MTTLAFVGAAALIVALSRVPVAVFCVVGLVAVVSMSASF